MEGEPMDKYSNKQVILLIVITLLGIILSVIFHKPLVIGFLPGFIFLIHLSRKKGLSFKEIIRISYKGIERIKIVIFILILVSFLLPSWYLSDTITTMVSITIQAVDPHHFFVFSFVTTLIFSMILGTSIGTLGALGIPLISTSMLLQLPIEVTAGAIISGAFVGDRTSPFSGTHQLLSNILEISVKKQGKAMLLTTIVGISISLVFYGFMDIHFGKEIHSLTNDSTVTQNISYVSFIPPFLLILLVVSRVNIIISFLLSILSASAITLVNGESLPIMTEAYWIGIEGLGGGLKHMYGLILFIAIAGAYNNILEELNLIQPFLKKWLQSSKSLMSDSIKTAIAAFIVSLIAANQTMPIILTGRSFLPHWSSKYTKEELARVMGDTAMLFPSMIPWNVLAILSSAVINMPLSSYLPFAIFLWSLPLLTIVVSLFKKQDTNYQYEVVPNQHQQK
jgi:Na+:H+ antiporter, NhaC family